MISCTKSTGINQAEDTLIIPPEHYAFTRDGLSTVSFSGQTARLYMADELYAALNADTFLDGTPITYDRLDEMFNNGTGFTDANDLGLNESGKKIGNKTAASVANGSAAVKGLFDIWLADYANTVIPNFNSDATEGAAGLLTDAVRSIHVNAKGFEIDQIFIKGLIGALALDQIVNNYITPAQLDAGERTENNDNGMLSDGKNYTEMEHKWDEGFGYLYGQEADITKAAIPEGNGNLLNKYFKKVDDSDDPGIAQTVYDAFVMGRAAIVAKNYTVRDQQATIIKVKLSKIIGYKAAYYLNTYVSAMQSGNTADAFHALSEAYGFILSLQFTNNGADSPYFSKTEVDKMLENLTNFWVVDTNTCQAMAEEIENRFELNSP